MKHPHRKRKRTVAPDAAAASSGRAAPVRAPKHLLPLGAALMVGGLSLSAAAQTTPPGGQEPALPELTVKGERETEDGALARSTRIGKVVQDPHEIAQSITIITNQLMQEQQVSTLKDAMRNVPGLTFNAAEGGRSGDNMSLRGFYTFGDMYLDAIRDTAQYNRETFNFEQIDVLRGASSMLFGRGQAGGVINQVSKTPLRRDQYLLTASVGQWDYHELTADLNARLTQNESIRVNLMSRGEGSWRSNPASGTEPELYRDGIGLSFGFNLYTNNQFWLNQYTLRTRDNPDYGVAFDAATRLPGTLLPVETFFGIDSTFDDSNTNITTLVNEYRFAPNTQLRTQLRYGNYKRSYWAKTPSLTIPPNAIGSVGGNQTRGSQYETVTLQSDFSTTQRWFDMTHGLLAGIEYLYEDSSRKGLQNFGTVACTGLQALRSRSRRQSGRIRQQFVRDLRAGHGRVRAGLEGHCGSPARRAAMPSIRTTRPRRASTTVSGATAAHCPSSPSRRRITTSATAIRSVRPPICIS